MKRERRVLAYAMVAAIVGVTAVATVSGRDLPTNVTGLLLAGLGAAYTSSVLERKGGDK